MIWSISSYREFQRCSRKWFYNHKAASRSIKNPIRREIHLLSELESIEAWRGKIVDYTISEFVVPKLTKRQNFTDTEVFDFAKKVARARYNFAKDQRYKDDDLKKTDHEFDYAALYHFEYQNGSQNMNLKLTQAWGEIELALKNFLGNRELLSYLQTANYLVTQRNLKFGFNGFTIQAVPDLIAFFAEKPPHIIDWKVHYFGTKSYNEQLMVYALALVSCNPHKDFPPDLSKYSVTDINLSEYQLLKNTVRNYNVTVDHLEVLKDGVADGIYLMERKKCDSDYKDLDINDFEKTRNLDNCNTCAFKKLCYEE
jgi:hypothetical protein